MLSIVTSEALSTNAVNSRRSAVWNGATSFSRQTLAEKGCHCRRSRQDGEPEAHNDREQDCLAALASNASCPSRQRKYLPILLPQARRAYVNDHEALLSSRPQRRDPCEVRLRIRPNKTFTQSGPVRSLSAESVMKIGPKLIAGTICATVFATVGVYFGIPFVLGEKVAALSVVRSTVVQTVVASGRVETPSGVNIGSQIIGTVLTVLVRQGAAVRKGDALITLDDRQARAAVDQAAASLSEARTSLRQVEELTLPLAEQTLIQTKATLRNAESQLARALQLAERSIATGETVEDLQRAFDIAKTEVRSAELQVKSLSVGGSGHAAAKGAVVRAEAVLRAAQAGLGLTLITAPVTGVVIQRAVEKGAIVQAGTPLLVLAPDRSKQLVVQIDERNLDVIRIAQPALASADAYPEENFRAAVATISPTVDADKGSVEVKLSIDAPPSYLKEDMTVSVDIEVARHENALVVANAAVRDAASAAPKVLLILDGHAVERPVTLGLRGIASMEILDGLVVGDLVIPSTVTTVVAGARVRVADGAVSP